MAQPPATNKYRATKDPHADCPTVEEYEIRRRLAIDAATKPAAKPTKSAAA
jgi:hypothetical protein